MRSALALTFIALIAAGCSMSAADEAAVSDESALRALSAEEIVGQIAYGETKEVAYTPAPKYRALAFQGVRGDTVEAKVVAQDGTDPILWLTDESFNTIALSDNPKPTDTNPLLTRTLVKSGTFYLVFREMTFAPRAKFAVTLTKTDAVAVECDPDGEGFSSPACTEPTFDPFDPASCAGPALTAAEASAKLGALELPEEKSYIHYRTRQCTGESCTPWVRAFAMDITLLKAAAGAAPNAFAFSPAATRTKVKIDFTVEPAALTQLCLDGPFATLRSGGSWTAFTDGTPGVCGSAVVGQPVVTATCARFETPTIVLGVNEDPTRTVEYGAVLLARY